MAEVITFPETKALEDKLPININAVNEICDSYGVQNEKTRSFRAGVRSLCDDMQEINDDIVEILRSRYAFFMGTLEIVDIESLDEDSFNRIAGYLESAEKREADYVDSKNRIGSAIMKMRECRKEISWSGNRYTQVHKNRKQDNKKHGSHLRCPDGESLANEHCL